MHKKYFGNTPPSEKYSKKRTCQQKCMIVFRDGLQKNPYCSSNFIIIFGSKRSSACQASCIQRAVTIFFPVPYFIHNWFIFIPKFSVTDWNQSLTLHITIYWDGGAKVTYACVRCFTLSSYENRKQFFSQAENLE